MSIIHRNGQRIDYEFVQSGGKGEVWFTIASLMYIFGYESRKSRAMAYNLLNIYGINHPKYEIKKMQRERRGAKMVSASKLHQFIEEAELAITPSARKATDDRLKGLVNEIVQSEVGQKI